MKKDSIIRTIYLYIFTLVGLILVVIGGVRFLDMGLKMFVFTQAEQEYEYDYREPKAVTIDEESGCKECVCPGLISNEERITQRRHRDASESLAMIFVGIPLYLYHWSIIKRESKEKKAKNLAESENA